MEAVQAQVLSHYRSELVERIRASGGVLQADGLTVKLAKEFGFCYGVERAIDLAYAAKKYFSETAPNTPIYLLGEIIHNPEVNDQIRNMGIQIISPKPTDEELAKLKSGDAVIIPAFGTEVGTRKKIEEKGCKIVDTTCGDVMSVWKRVRQYSKENVTSIIHGKAKHEETKATTSQARAYGSGHYLVVFTLAETDYVCDYILNGGDKNEFLEKFKGAYSAQALIPTSSPGRQRGPARPPCCAVKPRKCNVCIKKRGNQNTNTARKHGCPDHFRFFDTICSTGPAETPCRNCFANQMDLYSSSSAS